MCRKEGVVSFHRCKNRQEYAMDNLLDTEKVSKFSKCQNTGLPVHFTWPKKNPLWDDRWEWCFARAIRYAKQVVWITDYQRIILVRGSQAKGDIQWVSEKVLTVQVRCKGTYIVGVWHFVIPKITKPSSTAHPQLKIFFAIIQRWIEWPAVAF